MKKVYYLLFYKLALFFRSVSDDGFEKPKALIVINAICILFAMELLVWWTIITKYGVDIPKYWLIIPVMIIIILNYNFLMSKDNWKQYEGEFIAYSRSKNVNANLFVLGFILLILGSLIFSFYKMSLIDWSIYQR